MFESFFYHLGFIKRVLRNQRFGPKCRIWEDMALVKTTHYFEILSCKTNSQAHNDLALPSWGPNESFDTHIVISIYVRCQMANAHMAFLAFCHK